MTLGYPVFNVGKNPYFPSLLLAEPRKIRICMCTRLRYPEHINVISWATKHHYGMPFLMNALSLSFSRSLLAFFRSRSRPRLLFLSTAARPSASRAPLYIAELLYPVLHERGFYYRIFQTHASKTHASVVFVVLVESVKAIPVLCR